MNVWEYSYLCPESLRAVQGISDKLERMNIGLFVMRQREALLGVKPPHVVKVSSEGLTGVRTRWSGTNDQITCPVCGLNYYRVHWCKEVPAANRDRKEIDPRD